MLQADVQFGKQWSLLLTGSILFGLFWELWALVYWLPENFEGFANPGQWSVVDFGLHALTFTLMLMAGHWLLGQGGWQAQFTPWRPSVNRRTQLFEIYLN